MSDEFQLEGAGSAELRVWRDKCGTIQLAVDDSYDGCSITLTAKQARDVAAALIEEADRIDCVI